MNALRFKEHVYGWILVGPFVLTLFIFFIYALIRTLYFSFTSYDLFTDATWVGLNNFKQLITDKLFIIAFINTTVFAFVVTIIQVVLSLGLALLVNSKIRAKSFFRTAFYLPSILSSAAITLIFIWFYQKNGFLNGLLQGIANNLELIILFISSLVACQIILVLKDKYKGLPIKWIDPAWAIVSLIFAAMLTSIAVTFGWVTAHNSIVEINWLNTREQLGPLPVTLWAIVIQNIYTTIPTFMLLYLAGLQGIPQEIYEAARVDGATKVEQIRYITIPQLAPVTFLVMTFSIIGTLQMFDQVALLGTAAPLESRITLAYYVFHNAFPPGGTPKIGLASAASLILAGLTLLIVYLQKTFGVKETMNG